MKTLCVVAGLFVGNLAWAHDPGLSTAAVSISPGQVEAVVTFALRDATLLAESSQNSREPTLPSKRESQNPDLLKRLVSEGFCLELDGKAAQAENSSYSRDENGNTSVKLVFTAQKFSKLSTHALLLSRLPFGHRQYLTIRSGGAKPFAEALLSANADSLSVQVPDLPAQETGATVPCFLLLGIKHILTGYDHLLFLFGLLLVTTRLATALRIITCFTLAHSLTLALATLGPVPAPARFVEPLIAASIVYVGFENLLRGSEPKGRWLLTFLFGLIHGCGFASALRELGVGSNGGSIVLPLVSFNLGVEAGQLAIASLLLPLLWRLRNQPVFVTRFVPIGSTVVMALGGFWLLQRVLT